MTTENRNLILAVVLSALVLFGWTFVSDRYFPAPKAPVAATATADGGVSLPSAGAAVPTNLPVEQALGGPEARVAIETPRLKGSVNLVGARIDDLELVDHHQTLEGDDPIRLFSPSGTKDAEFAGFGWVGAGAPPADARWTADSDKLTPAKPLTLRWTSPDGVQYVQTISVDENFVFAVKQSVVNRSGSALVMRPYGYVQRTGIGAEADAFNVHVGPIAVLNDSLKESEISFDTLTEDGPQTISSKGGWLGITQQKWLAALIPDQKSQIEARFTPVEGGRFQVDWMQPSQTIAPGRALETNSHLFAGAKEVAQLNKVRDELGAPLFDRALAWGWFWFIAQPIFALLQWLYGLFGNYALAIIGLTVIVRILLFPIANKQYASMAKMRIFAPKMKEIQEKYKDDKQKQQFEMMDLYRREKINPLAGCLPILLQIPIFYALYKVLLIAVEIRHQPGFGWIKDLSAQDPLTPMNAFGLIPWDPPGFLHLGVLAIILGVTMWAQFKLNPQPMDEIQAKLFSWMPWVFMFMMSPFAAGLQIYWIVNNLISIAQQWVMQRKYPVPAPAPAAASTSKKTK